MDRERLTVRGVFEATAQAFGFVRISEAEELFIPPDCVHGALEQDLVECRITESAQRERKAVGEVVRIISHGLERLPGDYIAGGWVIADLPGFRDPIQIVEPREGAALQAVKGHKVIVRLTQWPEQGALQGIIEEDLGDAYAPTARIRAVICTRQLPMDFSEEVLAQARAVSAQGLESAEELSRREDLRGLPMVTIDGEDARDLDDAVSLQKTADGYELGVHIADVSWYVREGSALDAEAYNRGTSVYLTDRVIPMLPPQLSNGICSLNAGEDRYAISCLMQLDKTGVITGHRLVESIIRVDRRMSYTNVQLILEGSRLQESERTVWQTAAMAEYAQWTDTFCQMAELAALRRQIRLRRGSVEFDFPECKIEPDAYGYPQKISLRQSSEATGLIEEFMLAANETVAEEYHWREIPFIYRVHPHPEEDRVMELSSLLSQLGHPLKGARNGQLHSRAVQELLESLRGEPEESMISRMVLRSMKQARYSAEPENGHFGLAAEYYCHFTSPIRRYPDLMVHRMIRAVLRNRADRKYLDEKEAGMDAIASRCSFTERRAQDAERDVEKYMKALYMSDRVRGRFNGIVSGVTERGLYVELPDTVEGFIPMEYLEDDYYLFDRKTSTLTGKHRGRVYRLGQPLAVKTEKVDLASAVIYFRPLVVRMKKVPRRKKLRW